MLKVIRRKVIFKKRRDRGREKGGRKGGREREREDGGVGRREGEGNVSSISCGLEFIMVSVTVSVYARMCFFFLTLSA